LGIRRRVVGRSPLGHDVLVVAVAVDERHGCLGTRQTVGGLVLRGKKCEMPRGKRIEKVGLFFCFPKKYVSTWCEWC
jgi:hypothetical protein